MPSLNRSFARLPRSVVPLLAAAALPACAVESSTPPAPPESTATTVSAYTTRTPVDRNVASFMAIDANVAYALDTGGNLWRDGLPAGGHTKIDGNVKAFQPIPGDYYVYVLGADGNLWFEPNGIAGRTFVAGGVQAFQAMGIGFVYWKDASNNLWYQVANAAPTLVDRNVNTFHAASQTAIYVLGTDANLWNENGDYTHRSLVEPNVLAYAPVNGTNVYVEETDAALWNEAGSWNNRFQVDSSVLRFAPIDDNYLLVEGGDGNLWREAHDWNFRDLVDGNVKAFSPIGTTAAWVLGNDGNLWREELPVAPLVYTVTLSSGWSTIGIWPTGQYTIEAGLDNNNLFSSFTEVKWSVWSNATGQTFNLEADWWIGSESWAENVASANSPALVTGFPALASGSSSYLDVKYDR